MHGVWNRLVHGALFCFSDYSLCQVHWICRHCCIEQLPMNEVCLEMPLTNIALSHDTVEKNTYISIHRIPFLQSVWNVSICLVYPIDCMLFLWFFLSRSCDHWWIFHKYSFIYLVVTRKNVIFVMLIPGSLWFVKLSGLVLYTFCLQKYIIFSAKKFVPFINYRYLTVKVGNAYCFV